MWHRRFGTTSRDGWDVVIEPDASGWEHTGLYAAELAPSESRTLVGRGREFVVVPLSGSVEVAIDGPAGPAEVRLAGRDSVFSGPTDVAYVPPDSTLAITGVGPGRTRVAVAFAVTARPGASQSFRHVVMDDVPVEHRGAGATAGEVRDLGVPGVLDADSIIVREVATPAGCWSSWPPHKHDEERSGEETQLEEIYYFEVQPSGGGPSDSTTGMGFFRVHGTDERPIEVLAEVRSGDVVLVPHGWHGPAMAPPGYELYSLNVLAGPGPDRVWLARDEPEHAWLRDVFR